MTNKTNIMALFLPQNPYYSHGPISGPYHTGPYMQTGGSVFKWLGHMARSVLFPFLAKAGKAAVKSKTVKKIARNARQAAIDGAVSAGSQILKGENVKKAVTSGGSQAATRIKNTIKRQAAKVGDDLLTVSKPAAKKKKKKAVTIVEPKPAIKPRPKFYVNKKKKGRPAVIKTARQLV